MSTEEPESAPLCLASIFSKSGKKSHSLSSLHIPNKWRVCSHSSSFIHNYHKLTFGNHVHQHKCPSTGEWIKNCSGDSRRVNTESVEGACVPEGAPKCRTPSHIPCTMHASIWLLLSEIGNIINETNWHHVPPDTMHWEEHSITVLYSWQCINWS